MEVEYLKLIKVDHENDAVQIETFEENGDVHKYLMSIIDYINGKDGDRSYEFKQGELTMPSLLKEIILNHNRDDQAMLIARRLLEKEKEAQEKYENITDIQKGVLLIAYCKMVEHEYKLIICKSDYSEFLEETTGNKKNGLPTKKKIFKSFTANVSVNAAIISFDKIVTYDVNTKVVKYWYDSFLDLKEQRDDAINTEKAFDAIQSKVLLPIKKNNRRDYLMLRNMTIAYFRSAGEFDINHYADEIIGKYTPVDENINKKELVVKIKQLPGGHQFDAKFFKVPDRIKAKMIKDTIPLSKDIDLVLKKDVPDIARTIKAYEEDDGSKFIMIRSNEGYDYAKGLDQEENNR